MLVKKFSLNKVFHVRDEQGNVYKVSEIIAHGSHNEKLNDITTELYRTFRFLSPDLATISIFKQSKNLFLRKDTNEILKLIKE